MTLLVCGGGERSSERFTVLLSKRSSGHMKLFAALTPQDRRDSRLILPPHPVHSNDNCLEVKTEDHQNCAVLCY